jgi:hypothetical protein
MNFLVFFFLNIFSYRQFPLLQDKLFLGSEILVLNLCVRGIYKQNLRIIKTVKPEKNLND